jgi:predicted thioesterase
VKRSVPKKKRTKVAPRAKAAGRSRHSPKISQANPKHATHAGESKLRPGLQASIERVVLYEWTIASLDSRLRAVLSPPHMIGLTEIAAVQAIMAELPPGAISVGRRIEVDHLKAIPVGATVRATGAARRTLSGVRRRGSLGRPRRRPRPRLPRYRRAKGIPCRRNFSRPECIARSDSAA